MSRYPLSDFDIQSERYNHVQLWQSKSTYTQARGGPVAIYECLSGSSLRRRMRAGVQCWTAASSRHDSKQLAREHAQRQHEINLKSMPGHQTVGLGSVLRTDRHPLHAGSAVPQR